jgi:hypothetical protein
MRARERSKLGMDLRSLLEKRTANRQRRFAYPPSSPYLLKQDPIYIDIPGDFKLPEKFAILIDELQQKLYMIDPLDSLGKKKDTNVMSRFSMNRRTESILNRLILAEVAKLGHDEKSKKLEIPFDELISYSVSVKLSKEAFFFDLRNFLYLTVVFPHGMF